MGKRMETLKKEIDFDKEHTLSEGIALVKKTAKAKFDETIELHFRLGIDVRQSDQQVRGTVILGLSKASRPAGSRARPGSAGRRS